MKKILIFNRGIETSVSELLLEFNKIKKYSFYHLSFYNGNLKKFPKNINSTHIRRPRPKYYLPFLIPLTKKYINNIGPDLIHSTFLTTYGFLSSYIKEKPKIIQSMASDILLHLNKYHLNFLVRKGIKASDIIIVDSKNQKTIIKKIFPKKNIEIIPIGINKRIFTGWVSNKKISKGYFKWENRIIVICTRNHEKIYGIEYLLRAIPLIIKKNNNIRFIFLGHGSLTKYFLKITSELQIQKYVKFLGSLKKSDVNNMLSISDIYISPSLSDGTSVSMLEAIVCGKPMIVTKIVDILEWVDHKINGIIIPKKNIIKIVKSILELANNPILRKTISENNLKLANQVMTFEDYSKKIIGCYKILLENNNVKNKYNKRMV